MSREYDLIVDVTEQAGQMAEHRGARWGDSALSRYAVKIPQNDHSHVRGGMVQVLS